MIRPHPATRVSLAAVFAALAVSTAVTDPATWPFGALLGLLALPTGFRGVRAAVLLDARHVTVRGFLWSRTIPRSAITAVVPDAPFGPRITWTGPHGKRRSTPLLFLSSSSGTLRPIRAHHERRTRELTARLNPRRRKTGPHR
ncbi:hypothetical protein [Actinocorallia lasiicapitis]